MKTDSSYGIIPFHQTPEGKLQFLIIHQTNGYRGFPKGHKESGESDQQAALRELQEETSITHCTLCDPDHPLVVEYRFLDPKINHPIQKTVYYFLGAVDQQGKAECQVDNYEVDQYYRGDLETLKQLLTHQNSKDLLDQAFLLLTHTQKNA
ncbi:MAG: NUDIX domain-containing protein [bacterium]|nr:NUDIX domain-containing protein [bacterium]